MEAKSFREILDIYMPHMDDNPNWVDESLSAEGTLAWWACRWWIMPETADDRRLAERVLVVLAEHGVDIPYEEGGLNDLNFCPEGQQLVRKIVNITLNNSATESAAFEDEKISLKDKIKNAITKTIGGIKTLANGGKDVENIRKKFDEEDANNKALKNSITNYKLTNSNPIQLKKYYEQLSTTAEKELFIFENLPIEIDGTSAQQKGLPKDGETKLSRAILAGGLVKEKSPYDSDLYYVITHPVKRILPEIANILITSKFELPEVFKKYGTEGLKMSTKAGLSQIKIIAFFNYKGFKFTELRNGNTWRSLEEMKEYVSSLDDSGLKQKRSKEIVDYEKVSPGKAKKLLVEKFGLGESVVDQLKDEEAKEILLSNFINKAKEGKK